ncbi:hypothetical protein BJ878DRAFT_461991 [Calycina marina]|uniref:Heterokaryon incompatibility domain-containing protein n=1 Tax=Calycina marina TaxID=1763456 RepID=A0A9P8CFQ2_9HELO|nr:hypothetical protein BJ878DRAFT_461991 [Calycina marina]
MPLLGISYLWIDGLCIIQDNPKDWATESSQMLSIFGQCVFSIAAARAPNRSCGFFFSKEIPVFLASVRLSTFAANVLSTRAWVFQEHFLARRILYMSDTQMFWQCEGAVSELFSIRVPYYVPPCSKRRKHTRFANLPAWDLVVERYTHRDITFSEGKLPALAGIANLYYGGRTNEYCAGLWPRNIEGQLLCSASSASQPLPNRAPSWS